MFTVRPLKQFIICPIDTASADLILLCGHTMLMLVTYSINELHYNRLVLPLYCTKLRTNVNDPSDGGSDEVM